MSIVRMKRLRLIAMSEERDRLMNALARFGAVEISDAPADDGMPQGRLETDIGRVRDGLSEIDAAILSVKNRGKIKRGMFTPRIQISEADMFSSETMLSALEAAEQINEKERKLSSLYAKKSSLSAQRETLVPWRSLDAPLDTRSGKFYTALFCTVPSSVSASELETELYGVSESSEIYIASSDKEQHYVFLLYHNGDEAAIMGALKPLGLTKAQFKGMRGTALSNMRDLDRRLKDISDTCETLLSELAESGNQYDTLLAAHDALATTLECKSAQECARATESAFFIEGWFPAREEKRVAEFLDRHGCAYEFAEPSEDETPPTLTYNSGIISPFGVITDMYSPPSYRGIDPNLFVAPFFAMFFGIMLSDAAYGLLLALFGAFALIKLKPRGGFKSFMKLAVICGLSTVLWGALFGGFFGDAIPTAYTLFTGKTFGNQLALWFNPLDDPMKMLLFSFVLGAIQIVVGMALKGYMMIRDGHVWDAIFDIGFWWVLFGGIVVMILVGSKPGLIVSGIGALGLILTQGRSKKGIISKFFSGLLSLYDITGYFSDILSYSRLLALALSTAVVASVVNTMGAMTGPVGFVVVFIIGHVFNIAINLVGTFVHSARLQYVEFFGKFYEGGGRPFKPLRINTKNVEIIKEEK